MSMLLVAGLAGAYQVGVRSRRGPSFTDGGRFQTADDLAVAGRDGRPYPYGDVAVTTSSPSPSPVAPTAPTASPSGPAAPSAPSPATTPPAAAARTTATTGPAAAAATTPKAPAYGTYTYSVRGSESATGFGGRAFPPTLGVVVHGDPKVAGNERVLDVRMSDDHEERTIVRYDEDGVAFTFEAGSISFGAITQTSEGSYSPPMVQVPWPLVEGATASGNSSAVDGSGQATRLERWTATVSGREQVTVLGQPRNTWVVDLRRATDPGGAEQVERTRRYWYDPGIGTWVRWTERFHGSRRVLVADFTYDAEYTAELTGFQPS
ncbi:MAG TPA: hypothetical protein VHM89_13635 [Acidimicrobiales bacterium]|nr:hypothetical protein [Acidimicrobiales bacterium]